MHLKHLHKLETRFSCPETFLYLGSWCRDAVSELRTDVSGLRRANAVAERDVRLGCSVPGTGSKLTPCCRLAHSRAPPTDAVYHEALPPYSSHAAHFRLHVLELSTMAYCSALVQRRQR